MRRIALLLLLAACSGTPGPGREQPHETPGENDVPALYTPLQRGEAHGFRYLEMVTGGAESDDTLPMVIGLHGMGDEINDFALVYHDLPAKVRVVLPEAPVTYGDGFSWFETRVTGDQDRLTAELVAQADALAAFASGMAADRPTRGKPIVTGFSQGGVLSYVLAAHHPGAFAAAIPIGGLIPVPARPEKAPEATIPIHGLHGEADTVVALARTREGVDALKAAGFDVTLETWPDTSHTISVPMRERFYALITELGGAEPGAVPKKRPIGPDEDTP